MMRELINKLEQLNEATGLAGRKPGDTFTDNTGQKVTFEELRFFPEQGGKYSPEELDKALMQVSGQMPNIYWQNAKSARSGGFALASFAGEGGTFTVGRYLEQTRPSPTDNYVPNSFTTDGTTWNFGGKAAKSDDGGVSKTESKLSPQDLLGDKIDLSIEDIMNQLAMSLGTDNPLYAVAHRLATGEPLPMTFPAPEGYNFAAFRDYFCEILQPIALQKGQYTGNAGEAAARFLGGGFESTLISFDDSKTAGLSDSVLTMDDGRYIKVSTKGGKGATASVKNLSDSIQELEGSKEGKKILKQHTELLKILETIKDAGQYNSPLVLAQEFNIITPEEATKIQKLRNSQLTSLKNVGALGLSKKLQNLALNRGTADPDKVNLFYHLTAAVAHKVAEYVNKHTSFSSGATAILNNGALVQMYTKATEGQSNWTLKEFNTVYPGTSIKGVFLDAGKNYYSTAVKGNFTFKIDKGAGVEKDEAPDADLASDETDLDSSDDFAATAQDIVNPVRKARETGTREKRK